MDTKVFRGMSVSPCYHVPVLCEPAATALITDPEGIYVDATFGGGGHSRAILERLAETGRLFGIDQDPEAPFHTLTDPRFTAIRGNFREITALLADRGVSQVSGILADLGLSSHQIDTPERGFSYRQDSPLDLRMNPTEGVPAWAWLSTHSTEEIARVLREYGDLPKSRRLAALVQASWRPEFSTQELARCVRKIYGPLSDRYLAPTFQALRIAVNDERGALRDLLKQAASLLLPGGRLVLLTYHSGEARLVKTLYQQPITENPITGERTYGWRLLEVREPEESEKVQNPRSRSAKLWIVEKL